MAHTALLIERLLQFSLQHSLIGELDAYVARNTLLDLFGLSEPWADGVPEEHLDVPTCWTLCWMTRRPAACTTGRCPLCA